MAKRILAGRRAKGKVAPRAKLTDHEVRLLRELIGSFVADGLGAMAAYRAAANYIEANGIA